MCVNRKEKTLFIDNGIQKSGANLSENLKELFIILNKKNDNIFDKIEFVEPVEIAKFVKSF